MLRWNSLFSNRLPKGKRRKGRAGSSFSRRLAAEPLEDRRMLAVVTVNTISDVADGNTDSIMELINSPGDDGVISLREAIRAANNDTNEISDMILFASSLDNDTINLSDADDMTFGPSALVVTSNISIVGSDAPFLQISRDNSVDNLRLFYVTGEGNLSLRDITLTNGMARGGDGQSVDFSGGGGGGAGMGGAVFNEGSLTVFSSTFTGNQAVGGTGGNSVDNSTAENGGNGGDPNGGPGGSFDGGGGGGDGGFGGGGGGGGTGVEVPGGTGGMGGFGGGGGGGGSSIATDSFGSGGAPGFGGGIGGMGAVLGSAGGGGGGGGAGMGGAIFNHGGQVGITNSTFVNNQSAGGNNGQGQNDGATGLAYGGAVFSRNGGMLIVNATLSGNSAKNGGGGLFGLGDNAEYVFVLANTIVANSDGGDVVVTTEGDGSFDVSGGGNLIEQYFEPDGLTALMGTIVSQADPELGDLADNGGPTRTLLPDPIDSPVRDAGGQLFLSLALPFDQRGFMRVQGVSVDIGAVEFQEEVEVTVDLAVTKDDSPDPVQAGDNITYTITVTNNSATTAAENVVLTDMVPTGTTYQSFAAPAGWTASTPSVGATGPVTAMKTTLDAGASAMFTLIVKVDDGVADGSVINNTATVTNDVDESNPNDNSDSSTTIVFSFMLIDPDELEDNDTLADATVLGSPPFVTVTDVTIDNVVFFPEGEFFVIQDEDYYKYTAHYTGKLIVRTLFENDLGNLDLQILDMNGNVIETSATSSDESDQEEIIIPVVSQEMYFVHVYASEELVGNAYTLEIENFPAPIPERPELHPDDDNGASSTDNITSVEDPRIFIQADLADFADMGITILTSEQAEEALTPGAAVEVFINGISQGYADAVGASNTLFQFQLESDVLDGGLPINGGALNFITAAVRIFDGKQIFDPPPIPIALFGFTPTPATGRTMLSEPLELRTIEYTGPQVTDVFVTGFPDYDLFQTKPTTKPTPLVDSLTVEFAETYEVDVNAPFTYEDISGFGTAFSGDDISMEIPIGFQFPFFDEQYTDLFVSTNGFLTFDGGYSGVPSATNTDLTLPGSSPSLPIIAPLWDDWDIDPAFAGRGYYQTLGTAGVDLRLVVQWHDVEHWPATGVGGTVDFEVVLFENGTIEFRYNDVTTGVVAENNGASATVGIRADEPTAVADGDVYQISFNQASVFAGQAIRFFGPIDPFQAAFTGNYQLVGDANGHILIDSATYIAPNKVELHFASPLPDDRFTFTIFDSLTDLAGNALDGESQAASPGGAAQLPSGNGVPGGDFVARFTVDSRAEIGTWAASSVLIDTNGNYIFDPANTDYVNRDLAYRIGFPSDYIFAGKFSVREKVDDEGWFYATGFDTIAAYGHVNGQYRWLIDTDDNGVVDLIVVDPASINGVPVAGNFDGNAYNGDEVGLFDGKFWYFDTDHDFQVDTTYQAFDYTGFPISGDFDGPEEDGDGELPMLALLYDFDNDGDDDVGTYLASNGGNIFYVDLNEAGPGNDIVIDGFADFSFRVGYPGTAGFGFSGSRERPVAADFNGDGIDDFGLYVVDGIVPVPNELAEWYLLLSGDDPFTANTEVTVLDRILDGPLNGFVPFSPFPFANDLYAQFGNTFSLPIAGNFDPPGTPGVVTAPSQTPVRSQSSTSQPSTTTAPVVEVAKSTSTTSQTKTTSETPKVVEPEVVVVEEETEVAPTEVVVPTLTVAEPTPPPAPVEPEEEPTEPVVEKQIEPVDETSVVVEVVVEEPAPPALVVEEPVAEEAVVEQVANEAVPEVVAKQAVPDEPVVEPAVVVVAERVEPTSSEKSPNETPPIETLPEEKPPAETPPEETLPEESPVVEALPVVALPEETPPVEKSAPVVTPPPVVEQSPTSTPRSRVRTMRFVQSKVETKAVSPVVVPEVVQPAEEKPAEAKPPAEKPPVVASVNVTATIDTVDATKDLAEQKQAALDKALTEIAPAEISSKTPEVVPEVALLQAAAWQSASSSNKSEDDLFTGRRFHRLVLR